jgi:RNA polymerase sigma factor (sigma-70 family)
LGTISAPAAGRQAFLPPKRVLALLGDDRLVDQIRRGNERAFEVAYERHGPGILSFCRHMLGQLDEAEDAVQHTFASAFRDLGRDERPIRLKPWLYAIARNRCISLLRARRSEPVSEIDPVAAGLDEHVQRRADLRQLVSDLQELPPDQRAALLLSEVGDLAHNEVAEVLGCEVAKVKALVFRARSALIDRRKAREIPCLQIREQIATLHGGALRRRELRHHVSSCAGCREFRDQVRAQRRMLGVALPVLPSSSLKASVLGAAGIGGGHAGGGLAAGGVGAALTAPLGSATVAKVAVIGAVAVGGGAVATDTLLGHHGDRPAATPGHSAGVSPARAAERGPRRARPATPARTRPTPAPLAPPQPVEQRRAPAEGAGGAPPQVAPGSRAQPTRAPQASPQRAGGSAGLAPGQLDRSMRPLAPRGQIKTTPPPGRAVETVPSEHKPGPPSAPQEGRSPRQKGVMRRGEPKSGDQEPEAPTSP